MKKLISIEEACQILGVGRTSVYRLISDNKLQTLHIGRRHLVVMESIDRLLKEAA